MPLFAKYKTQNSKPICADKVPIDKRSGPFYCSTHNCPAEMILVNGADIKRAYFRSKNRLQHISNDCIKNSITFNESDWNELLFDNSFAFESILGLNHSISTVQRGSSGTATYRIGGSRNLRIHTLPALVAMCINRGKGATYNGVLIDDILADNENLTRYQTGICGYKVVEVTFYKKSYNELALIYNYPANNYGINSWVKVCFPNDKKDLFWKQYNKCKSDKKHSKILYIAGNWEKCTVSNEGIKPHSYCNITSSHQFYWATI